MNKKILFVGDLKYDIYEKSLGDGFKKIDYDVYFFKSEKNDFKNKLINKLNIFYHIFLSCRIDLKFLEKVKIIKPDIIFLWRALSIKAKTIKEIKDRYPRVKIILHHNDNPFVNSSLKLKCINFFKCIKLSDLVLAYRKSDFFYIKKYGGKKIKLFLPYMCTKKHKPHNLKKNNDVIFIGHYEDDNRVGIIKQLHKSGVKYEIYGNNWEKIIKDNKELNIFNKEFIGLSYSKKIASSKIALIFLSKTNKDVYTRRCFEIPACKTLMLMEENNQIKKIFKENKEIFFWNNTNKKFIQVLQKILNIKYYNKIVERSFDKVLKKHNEIIRAKEIDKWLT